jgi:hypothetical protein
MGLCADAAQSHASYGRCGLGSHGTDCIVALVREDMAAATARGETPALYGAKITSGGSGGARSSPRLSSLPEVQLLCGGRLIDCKTGCLTCASWVHQAYDAPWACMQRIHGPLLLQRACRASWGGWVEGVPCACSGTVCVLGRADAEGEAALARVVDAYAKSIGGYRAQVMLAHALLLTPM